MNTVALPASAPPLAAEADLVRRASRGESEAVAELFRRHGQVAWRLAQAISFDQESAVIAVGQGFSRTLRGSCKNRVGDDSAFRVSVLSAVYRTGIESARSHAGAGATTPAPATPAPSRPAKAAGTKTARSRRMRDEAVLMGAAFRSLPERWRAALWLTEVETTSAERVAAILGVSAAVASQLTARAARGLAGRFAQAHREVPEHVGPALRAIALAMPANLADFVTAGCKPSVSDPGLRFAPFADWLGERAVRPLQVAVGGLLGLGLIGLGLVGEGALVNTSPVARGALPAGSGPGVTSPQCFGLSCGAGGGAAGSGGGAGGNATGSLLTSALGAAGSTGAGGAGGGSLNASPSGSAPGAPGSPGSPGTPGTNPGGGGGGGGGGSGGNPPPTTPPTTQPPQSLINIEGVASVTQSGGSTTANLLPGKTGSPTASITVGCSSGIGLTIGQTTIGCPAPGTGGTPPTTTPPPSTTTTTVNLPPVVTTILNTASTLLHGL